MGLGAETVHALIEVYVKDARQPGQIANRGIQETIRTLWVFDGPQGTHVG